MYRFGPKSYVQILGFGIAAVALAVATIPNSSCFSDTETIVCETTGLRCPRGWQCSKSQDACIQDDCGDGIKADKEVCDDGNVKSGDGCSADCMSAEICGNNITDSAVGETCDDGNKVNEDGCSAKCIKEVCGNGILDPKEACDDGNVTPDDGCSADCLSNEACGNGIKDNDGVIVEECDLVRTFPRRPPDSAECDSDCTMPMCPDGHRNSKYIPPGQNQPEQCDDGGDSPGCDKDCTFAICGDGYANATADEECDNGILNSNKIPDACRKDCHNPSCGDGVTDPGFNESCDDGNNDNRDNCPDGPGGTCRTATCGDGFVRSGVEDCDPPGSVCANRAICSSSCKC